MVELRAQSLLIPSDFTPIAPTHFETHLESVIILNQGSVKNYCSVTNVLHEKY